MRILIFIGIIFLAGCAAQPIKMDIAEIQKSAALSMKDLRPEIEKQNKIFSLIVTNDAYATYRRGDALLDPPKMRLLQHRTFERFQSTSVPSELIVHHFVIYWNLQAELKRGALGAAFGGAVGAAIASSTQNGTAGKTRTLVDRDVFEALALDEYKRALYTAEENPNRASVFIVYLDAEMNGKRVFVKIISPNKVEKSQDAMVLAVESAIEYYLQQY